MEKDREEIVRRRGRRKKKRKILLSVFLAVLLSAAVAVFVVWKVFTVKEIVVEGNKLYSDKQIGQFIREDKYSWNSLYVLLKYRFLDVKEIPFIDSIEISLKNPHTVKVHVYEKAMLGSVYISAIGQNAYFDKDGFVVETSQETIEDVPQVEGLSCDKVVLYEKLPLNDEKVLRSLLVTTQALKKNEVVPEKIYFDEGGEISLSYGGIRVLLGGTDSLTQKILRLPYILPQLSGKTGTLHVENWTENSTDIIFQENK